MRSSNLHRIPATAAALLASIAIAFLSARSLCAQGKTSISQSLASSVASSKPWDHGPLEVAPGGHFLRHADGAPFFWQADTGWLIFQRLTREEVRVYLDDRAAKGFNVIQCMTLHDAPEENVEHQAAMIDGDPSRPRVTPGADPAVPGQYDYWDHVDFCISEAAQRGIYIALVPAWGSIVKAGKLDGDRATSYATFLAERYKDRPNIVWVNGGDIQGTVKPEVWNAIGTTIKRLDPNHLMTFHPFGRTSSLDWFPDAKWIDFDLFQSGHRDYGQIGTDDPATWKGEDNWRYVADGWSHQPPRPIIDGEPSYEEIPHGLHDPSLPRWTAADVRRYAWWSVLAGAAGHTYGDNSVMQMLKPPFDAAYCATAFWSEAIHDPGSAQMQYVKRLMFERPYFERRPDPEMIVGKPGERHDRIVAARGGAYAFVYAATGRSFTLQLGRIAGTTLQASWYSPRDGSSAAIGAIANSGEHLFDPPGENGEGNDWVLVLDEAAANFPPPGGSPARWQRHSSSPFARHSPCFAARRRLDYSRHQLGVSSGRRALRFAKSAASRD